MSYRAPVADILFTMAHVGDMDSALYPDLADGAAAAVLDQAATFAQEVLEPLNVVGDRHGAKLANGVVTTAPGFREAYVRWVEGGWAALTAPEDEGGMGLPQLLDTACLEMWTAANMAFMLCPMLSAGAIEALVKHGSPELRRLYLPKIVSGEWSATMNLTEPAAGSDLNALRARAERNGDGSYRIFGQKIYITYGEHDMADNIVHLVLARLPDAPAGTRGISLFLVPKFLLKEDGALGARNDLRCSGLEHKMGIHASPTCTMIYGDDGGATGWLIGEENRGLACMFTMMNNARLGVGLQGVAIAEAATQKALAYAQERRQGRPPGYAGEGMAPIVAHPDVRRMLMTMRALTIAARAICYRTAAAIDQGHRGEDAAARGLASARASLLTPVAKAFSTDVGNEVASLGVQAHGGMGFIEETGAAQYMRDARIAAIYEGTNGIQAIDLVIRKLPLDGGAAVAAEIADMRAAVVRAKASAEPLVAGAGPALEGCVDALEQSTHWLLERLPTAPEDALAGATPYLRLFGLARGGASLAVLAVEAHARGEQGHHIPLVRFYADNIAVAADGLARAVMQGAGSVRLAEQALA